MNESSGISLEMLAAVAKSPSPQRFTGMKVVFGIPKSTVPIAGLPLGRVRLRFRNDDFARVFIRTKEGIRRFFIEDGGGQWFAHEEGRNTRQVRRTGWFRGANVLRAFQLNPRLLT
jgi:hypothetical protein